MLIALKLTDPPALMLVRVSNFVAILIYKSFMEHLHKNPSKYSFIHFWRTVLNLGPAWLADVCVAKALTNIQISPQKGMKV